MRDKLKEVPLEYSEEETETILEEEGSLDGDEEEALKKMVEAIEAGLGE